ncbi:MAG: NAD(P)-dependent oxidoreductase [Bacteroidetes bacterium]|nr:NAD(P)-dependent oxidoreductase [Bacteroidota bacterium]MDF1864233.1 NAD(P)-dependent oxidoreductase [Saprospiraceae bacterium]
MKKILITGASGFVGGFLVEECLKRNLEVHAGIRKTSSRSYLQDDRIHFFEVDFPNVDLMTEKLKLAQFDYIIHNAGIVAAEKKEDYFRVNTEYTKRFVESIQKSKIPSKFLYMSSIAAYGPASPTDKSDFLKNEYTPAPITSYGKSKLDSEYYLKTVQDLPYIVVRPTVVYGPREKDLFTFFQFVSRHLQPKIGFQKQDLTFIHVKDLVRVVVDATLSTQSNKSYFIADGDHYSADELGTYVKKSLNKKTLKLTVPAALAKIVASVFEMSAKSIGRYPTFNVEKVAELTAQNWKCDIAPIKKDFAFKPEFDLETGLQHTIQWYQKNKWL